MTLPRRRTWRYRDWILARTILRRHKHRNRLRLVNSMTIAVDFFESFCRIITPSFWYTDWSQEDDAAYKRIMAGVGDSDSDSEVAGETQVGALSLIFSFSGNRYWWNGCLSRLLNLQDHCAGLEHSSRPSFIPHKLLSSQVPLPNFRLSNSYINDAGLGSDMGIRLAAVEMIVKIANQQKQVLRNYNELMQLRDDMSSEAPPQTWDTGSSSSLQNPK